MGGLVYFFGLTQLGVALSIGFLVGTMAAVVWSVSSQNSKFSEADLIIIYLGIIMAVIAASLLARIRGSLLRSILSGGKSLSEIVSLSFAGLFIVLAILVIPRLILQVPISHWVTEKSMFGMRLAFATELGGAFLAPFVEELVFRCWLQTRLTALVGIYSVPITAVIFAAVHGGFAFVMVLPTAVALSVIRYKSKALLPGILLHAMYNMIIYVSLFFVIGHKT